MSDVDTDGEILTLEETAKLLRIAMPTLYRYIKREDKPLPIFYINPGTPRVARKDFDLWLESQKEEIVL